jgi:hypothetical protein
MIFERHFPLVLLEGGLHFVQSFRGIKVTGHQMFIKRKAKGQIKNEQFTVRALDRSATLLKVVGLVGGVTVVIIAVINGGIIAVINGGIIAVINGGIIAVINGGIIAVINGGIIAVVNGGIIAVVNGGIIAVINGGIIAVINGGIIAVINVGIIVVINGGIYHSTIPFIDAFKCLVHFSTRMI